jgi:ABC-type multidrug transport system fused ATPase/permease subunit
MSTVNGLAVIRSYNLQQDFITNQINRVDKNKQIRLTKDGLEGWFAQRLSLLSFAVNMAAIAFCLLNDNSKSSLVGLLMTYALTLNEDILNFMFCYAYVETSMVSYERILNFMEIESEAGYLEYTKKWRTGEEPRDKNAITKGSIKFENYGIRYRPDLPFVLRNVNIEIKQGEKVGIVGRTGAGKSTIVTCLLRILEPS